MWSVVRCILPVTKMPLTLINNIFSSLQTCWMMIPKIISHFPTNTVYSVQWSLSPLTSIQTLCASKATHINEHWFASDFKCLFPHKWKFVPSIGVLYWILICLHHWISQFCSQKLKQSNNFQKMKIKMLIEFIQMIWFIVLNIYRDFVHQNDWL